MVTWFTHMGSKQVYTHSDITHWFVDYCYKAILVCWSQILLYLDKILIGCNWKPEKECTHYYTYMSINKEPTCVWDCQPASQEVEGPIGGVSHVPGQRFKVALSRQPAHKLSGIRVKLAVVQRVWAVGKRVQQRPVGHWKLPSGVMARA